MTTLISLILLATAAEPDKPIAPLKQAHAHNDYEHKRPLLDALEQGFCSVEADIWLSKEELLVAHTPLDLKSGRTLQKLYLDPLRDRVKMNAGAVYKDGPPFYLLIDVKTDATKTYAELSKVLEGYADILTVTRDGKTARKAVTVVISGNCDRDAITRQAVRFAAIDGRPADLSGDAPAELIPWVSASWTSLFKWDGTGTMPDEERTRLKEFVANAHKKNRMVRFWATPERLELWKELLAADVDLINTDKLTELREFILKESR
jgi:hypothetical protein